MRTQSSQNDLSHGQVQVFHMPGVSVQTEWKKEEPFMRRNIGVSVCVCVCSPLFLEQSCFFFMPDSLSYLQLVIHTLLPAVLMVLHV